MITFGYKSLNLNQFTHGFDKQMKTVNTPANHKIRALKYSIQGSWTYLTKLAQQLNLSYYKFKGKVNMHTNQVAHQAGTYPGFSSMKRLGVFLFP